MAKEMLIEKKGKFYLRYDEIRIHRSIADELIACFLFRGKDVYHSVIGSGPLEKGQQIKLSGLNGKTSLKFLKR